MYLQIIYATADVTTSLNSSRLHFCALQYLWPDKSVVNLWFAADPSKSHGTLCDGGWQTIALVPPIVWPQQDTWPRVRGQAAHAFLQGRTSTVLPERVRERPPLPSASSERLASAVRGMRAIKMTPSDKTKCRCRWCMIMLSVQPEVPLVQSSTFYWRHCVKFARDASKARGLMRSWPTNTAEDCKWTHSSQELLSIWPPSRCNKSAGLGEDMKAAVSWWLGQRREFAEQSLSLGAGEGRGLEVWASSSHRQLESWPSCLRQTDWRKV